MRVSARGLIYPLLLVGALTSLSAQEKPTRETLTLNASIERAFKSNPRLLQSERDLALAHLHSKEAKALFYPKVSLDMNYVRYRNETFGLTSPELGSVVLEAPLASGAGGRGNPLAENLYLG